MQITLESTQLIQLLKRVVRATDHAESRLDLIDRIANPQIASNADVIETVKGVNAECRVLREGLELLESDPEFANLVKRAQLIPQLLTAMGITQ